MQIPEKDHGPGDGEGYGAGSGGGWANNGVVLIEIANTPSR